jgi:hypothetical protein
MILTLTLLAKPAAVQAIPPLPSSFYGTVKVNDANVTDGTLMQALINGQVYAQGYTQTYQGGSVYILSIPGDDTGTPDLDGGQEGDIIQFKIGGLTADQTGTWHSGTNEELNLSVGSTSPPNTPAPTPTPFPTQTPIPTVPSAVPTLTPEAPTVTQTMAATSELFTETAVPTDPTAVATATPAVPTATPAVTETTVGTIISSAIIPSITFTPSASTITALSDPTQAVDAPPRLETPIQTLIILLAAVILSGLIVGTLFVRRKKIG